MQSRPRLTSCADEDEVWLVDEDETTSRTVHEEKLHSEPSTVLEPAIGHTPQYNWLAEVERMEEVEDVDDEPIAGTRAPPTPRTFLCDYRQR